MLLNLDSLFCLLQSTFESKEAYFRSIGYREDDGKLESTEDYLKRLESYMKVYGALVQVCHDSLKFFTGFLGPYLQFCQLLFHISLISSCLFQQTEIPGVQNLHGLQEGWAWLARFLNTLPANQYTAVSLNAFLQVSIVECLEVLCCIDQLKVNKFYFVRWLDLLSLEDINLNSQRC